MKTLYTLLYLTSFFGGFYFMIKEDIYQEVFAFAYAIIFLLLSIEQRIKEKIDKLNKNK
jgi:hypothetical protein